MSQAARTGRAEDDKPYPFRLLGLSTNSARTAYAVQRYMPARGGRPTGQPAWAASSSDGSKEPPLDPMTSHKQELSIKISTAHHPTLTKKKMRSWQEDTAARSRAKYPTDPNVLPREAHNDQLSRSAGMTAKPSYALADRQTMVVQNRVTHS